MEEEYAALLSNYNWDLMPRPPSTNVVTNKWLFRHKLTSDGSLDRYKARWVLRCFTQRPGVDYDESFSPIIMFATAHAVLSPALSRNWAIHQLDVKNAFLHGTLTETFYCSQPTGFVDAANPDLVCRLNRSLYASSKHRGPRTAASPPIFPPSALSRPRRTHLSSFTSGARTTSTSSSMSMTLCSRHPPPISYRA
jgi:hypothetical protein